MIRKSPAYTSTLYYKYTTLYYTTLQVLLVEYIVFGNFFHFSSLIFTADTLKWKIIFEIKTWSY